MAQEGKHIRILGIDPGLNHTGFGVIDVIGISETKFVTAGCIHVPAGELCERLAFIHRELSQIIDEVHPDLAACEIIFLNINPKSTLLLGQARGTAIACAAVKGLSVQEFSATAIKNSVVGTGRATKFQVQSMVAQLLHLKGILQPDAADALACALTCAHAMRLKDVQNSAMPPSQTGRRRLTNKANKRSAWEQLVKNKGTTS